MLGGGSALPSLDWEVERVGFEPVGENQHVAGHGGAGFQNRGGGGEGGDFVLEEVELWVGEALEVGGGEDEAFAAGLVLLISFLV